jgi:hypothetical protein
MASPPLRAGLARRPTSGLPIAPTRRTRRPPTRGRRNPPSSHSASQQPYDQENSDDPRDGCPQPHECSGLATLPSMGAASPVNVTKTKLKTTSSSRSSPVISRPTFAPIQPDGTWPVRRHGSDSPLVPDRFICSAQREHGHRASRRLGCGYAWECGRSSRAATWARPRILIRRASHRKQPELPRWVCVLVR